ncbi:MAG: ankyrin repeat domain-containing protein [bacterium]
MNFNKINLFKKIFIILLITNFLGNQIYAGNFFNIPPEKKLMDGAIENDIDLIKEALESGAEINTKDKYGNTALHLLVSNNNKKATAIILNHPDCDIDSRNISGNTPLHVTTIKNAVDCSKLLLQHGANVNAQNNFGQAPLHIAVIFTKKNFNLKKYAIILFSKIQIIKNLIFFGANKELRDGDEKTPIDICEDIELKDVIIQATKDRNKFENSLRQIKKRFRTKVQKREVERKKQLKLKEELKINTETSPVEQSSIIKEFTQKITAPAPQTMSKTSQPTLTTLSCLIPKPFIVTKKQSKEEMAEKLRKFNKEKQKTSKIIRKEERSKIERKRQLKLKKEKREKVEKLNREKKLKMPITAIQALLRTKTAKEQYKLNKAITLLQARLNTKISSEKLKKLKKAIKILQAQLKTRKLKTEYNEHLIIPEPNSLYSQKSKPIPSKFLNWYGSQSFSKSNPDKTSSPIQDFTFSFESNSFTNFSLPEYDSQPNRLENSLYEDDLDDDLDDKTKSTAYDNTIKRSKSCPNLNSLKNNILAKTYSPTI